MGDGMAELVTKRRSLPISHLIGLVFAGLWASAGSMTLAKPWRVGTLLVAVLVGAAILVRLMRDPARTAHQGGRFRGAPYGVAVLLEVLFIVIASNALPRYGYGTYLLQVVGVIVGLHFLGLWQATHSARMVGIAAGMCVVSAVGLALPTSLANGVRPGDVWTGFGNALVLWVGASRSR